MKTKRSYLSTAIAVATLALPGVVAAESSITPYFLVDASIGYADKEDTGKASDVDYYDSNISSSVFGARGSHDLGNGLTMKGWIEGDLNTSTGDVSGAGVFRREANVGIAGSFGEVSAGTRVNPLVIMNGMRFAMAGNSSSTNTSYVLGFADFFVKKSVTYIAPKMGGFTGQVMYGFEDSGTGGALAGRESMASGYARYDFSSAWLGLALQTVEGNTIDDAETGILAAGTTLGGLTLKASFSSHEEEDAAGVTTRDNEAWQVGTSYAFSPPMKAGIDYVRDDEGSSLVHVRGQFSLNKNLTFYAMVNRVDNEANGARFGQLWGASPVVAQGPGPDDGSAIAFATGAIISF